MFDERLQSFVDAATDRERLLFAHPKTIGMLRRYDPALAESFSSCTWIEEGTLLAIKPPPLVMELQITSIGKS